MARLSNPHRRQLNKEDFAEHPVWTWDEEMENVEPLSEEEPALEDYGDLFIKAKFKTCNHEFHGYLMGGTSFYGFAIFINDRKFMFNFNLTDFAKKNLNELFEFINCEPFDFFPVYYESSVHLKERQEISGYLQLSKRK